MFFISKLPKVFIMNKFFTAILLVLSASIMLIPNAQARDRDMTTILQQCGFGGLLVGRVSPISASSVNLTSNSGTTATTTHSLTPGMCISGVETAAIFINDSFNALEVDLALGKGEHLQALNTIISCNHASSVLRKEYAEYAASTSYNTASRAEKAEKLFQIVDHNLSSDVCSA